MRKWLVLLTPALVVLLGLGASRQLVGQPAAPPPVPAPDTVTAIVAEAPAAVDTTAATAAPAPVAAPAAIPEADETEVDPTTARATELLAELSDYAKAGFPDMPESPIREAGDLVNRDGAAATVFADALADADGRLRSYLRCVFFTVNDSGLRSRLLKTWRDTDPIRIRLAEVMADQARILAALADDSDPAFRIRVVDAVSAAQLADPEILAGLFRLADDAPDPKSRTRAAYRLSRIDDDAVRRRVIGMLEDGSRPLEQRQAVAMGLAGCHAPELRDTFLRILERGDTESVLVHALGGLSGWLDEPGVRNAVLAELARPTNPLSVRRQAASSLADGWSGLDESSRAAAASRLRGIERDLRESQTDTSILVHLIEPLCRNEGEVRLGDVQAVEAAAPGESGARSTLAREARETR